MSIFVTKNFRRSEFRCPCGCGKDRPIDPKLIYLLQSLREKIDRPIYISIGGGIRCKAYNRKIGGYPTSAHLFGRAVDISVKNMGIIDLAIAAKEIGFPRIGLYRSFIHIDTLRPVPSASWYRDGKGIYHYFKTLEQAGRFMQSITEVEQK